MAKKALAKTKSKTGNINIGGDASNINIIQGDNNVINLPPQYIKINSLHQLPSTLADFTGREDLLKEILNDFETSKGTTISCLTGLGGIGKTALGLRVAHQLKNKYPDAQIFLDLKGTTAPLTALDIARHVILSFEPSADVRGLDENNMQGAYQSILDGKRVLLYFDNARSGEQIAKLIPHNSCALIVTSRWTFPVAGLKVHKIGVLEEKEASEFLFELCPRVGEHAKDLAKACGYLPLALRIAGSYLQVNSNTTVYKYTQELTSVKNRLKTFARNREQAELTSEPDVFATFELSYNQLNEDQQKKWRTLGIFPAPFDSFAVAAMWEMEDTKIVEETLSLLMRYSLIDFNEISSRYELHDLLSDFALQKITKAEKNLAKYNHCLYYLRILHLTSDYYEAGGSNSIDGLKLFDLEWENIQSGQIWAKKNFKKTNIAKICNYYSGALNCIKLRLTLVEQKIWIQDSLAASRLLKDKKSEMAHLSNLAGVFYGLANSKKAIEFSKKSMKFAKEIGAQDIIGTSLTHLANTYAILLRKPKLALEYYWERLDLAFEQNDGYNIHATLSNIAATFMELGDLEGAVTVYNDLVLIFHKSGDYDGEAFCYTNLGRCATLMQKPKIAIKYFDKALKLFDKIGNYSGKTNVLINRGINSILLKKYHDAILDGNKALNISKQLNRSREEILASQVLGMAYSYLGDAKLSRKYFLDAQKLSKKTEIKHLNNINSLLTDVFR